MKRGGRQHGMVRTYPVSTAPWVPRPRPRSHGGLNSTPTAGLFAKVSTKPTNHSKFTGKCGRSMCRECHGNPASKSKDKVKGTQRLRSSSNVVSDNKLVTWRAVDAPLGLRLSGSSATSILDYLNDDDYTDDEGYDGSRSDYGIPYPPHEIEEEVECEANKNVINGEESEDLSICQFVWQLEDEDWFLV